ncbi:MAG: hypothetical protein JOY62_07095 [Acidobacteriaceae bacterium]|nr:hypothetical protein [Acidobacteriaceae bacterium]MBV9779724.1 hypothetical protein [Acidobacteriaceae bacterium]
MHSGKRPKTLTGVAALRLTLLEDKHVKRCAEAAGLTKSEWCRRVILNALDTPPETQLLLSEFLAMRAVFLALHTEALQGNKLTEQRIAAMIQQAEAKKYAMAENRIRAFQATQKTMPDEGPVASGTVPGDRLDGSSTLIRQAVDRHFAF